MVTTRSQRASAAKQSNNNSEDAAGADDAKKSKTKVEHHGHHHRDRPSIHDHSRPLEQYDDGGKDEVQAADGGTQTQQGGGANSSEIRSYLIIALLALITYAAYPGTTWGGNSHDPTVRTVFYYGWMSAVSTGLGVLPLCFVSEMKDYWVGISNAVAAGMMFAASYSLFMEGCTFHDDGDDSSLSATVRTATGCVLGLVFILLTKGFLDRHDDVKIGSLSGADTRKIMLIIFVMTLHSFSEGVGIGVSFGGEHGNGLGVFISLSLAVHNIPEGLAVAIVLLPRKVSKATAAIWCVVTSLPQPIMAVPAFIFVHHFLPLLPVGLGFAGGAMMWVAIMELLLEACEDTDVVTTGVVSTLALGFMIWLQRLFEI